MQRRQGVDVSNFDGDVNLFQWQHRHGIWSVIIRCGGSDDPNLGMYTDPRFERNYLYAKSLGLHVGVYYLSNAIDANEAKEHAKHCLSIIEGHVLDMPVYMDVEVNRQMGRPRALTDAIKAFCDAIRDAGYVAGVYTYTAFLEAHTYPDELRGYELWLAQWQDNWPADYPDVGGWQQGAKCLETGELLDYDPNDPAYQDWDWWQKDYPSMILGEPNMGKRNGIVRRGKAEEGAPYCSMNHDAQDGWAGMGTHIIGLGWGCAEFCAYVYNVELGEDNMGSCWNFAGDALCQDVNQGGGRWVFVDEPLPGDLVIYIRDGYNGRDYDDYGHVALYIGDGQVIGAYGIGRPGEPGYMEGGSVRITTVEEQSLGGGHRYLRNVNVDRQERPIPVQPASLPKSDHGMCYRMHLTDGTWLPSVRDGQTAGTVGQSMTADALKITPPAGVTLEVHVHVQDTGTLCFDGVRRGKSSGEGSSKTDPIMGVLGKRLEAVRIEQTKKPKELAGKLRYRGHVQGKGWTPICKEGQLCGTTGEKRRLEALEIWYE